MQYCDVGVVDFMLVSLVGGNGLMFFELFQLQEVFIEYIECYSLLIDFVVKFVEELKVFDWVIVVLCVCCMWLVVSVDGLYIEFIVLYDGQQQVLVWVGQFVLVGGVIEVICLLLCMCEELFVWQCFDGSLGCYYVCYFDLIFGEMCFIGEKLCFSFQKMQDGVYVCCKLQFML